MNELIKIYKIICYQSKGEKIIFLFNRIILLLGHLRLIFFNFK
jgi:hypothetical protein